MIDWNTIGAIAEVVGATAVLVTLIFLTRQIRQNTVSVRQQCYNDIMLRRQEWYRQLTESEDLTRIWWRGLLGKRMTQLGATRFMSWYMGALGHFEDVFIQYRNGVVEKDIWEREARLASASFSAPGFIDFWKEAQQYFLPEFIEEIRKWPPLPIVDYDEANACFFRIPVPASGQKQV